MELHRDANAKKYSHTNQKAFFIANFYQPMRFDLCCYDRDAQILIKDVARRGRHYGAKRQRGHRQYKFMQEEKTN